MKTLQQKVAWYCRYLDDKLEIIEGEDTEIFSEAEREFLVGINALYDLNEQVAAGYSGRYLKILEEKKYD